MAKHSRANGSVLLVSLWALAGLGGLVTAQTSAVVCAWRLWGLERQRWEAFDLTRKGMAQALVVLDQDAERQWDAPEEPWAHPMAQEEGAGIWKAVIADEGGKIPLNSAPWTVLARLPESTVNLAQAVVARRTERPFRSVAELALIPGMNPRILARWLPLVRAFGEKEVNLNSACAEVLEAMGLPVSTAARLLSWRDGPDGVAGTSDDRSFYQPGGIASALSESLAAEEIAVVMNQVHTGRLGVRSSSFRITVGGRSGSVEQTLEIGVERSAPGSPIRVREWHEAAASLP